MLLSATWLPAVTTPRACGWSCLLVTAALIVAATASKAIGLLAHDPIGTGAVFLLVSFAVCKVTNSVGAVAYAVLSVVTLDYHFFGEPNAFEIWTLHAGEVVVLLGLFAVPFIEGNWSLAEPMPTDTSDAAIDRAAASYAADVEHGAEIGHRLVADMADGQGHPYLLGWSVRKLVEKRQFGALEVGMFGAIARCAISGRDGVPSVRVANHDANDQQAQLIRLHVDR